MSEQSERDSIRGGQLRIRCTLYVWTDGSVSNQLSIITDYHPIIDRLSGIEIRGKWTSSMISGKYVGKLQKRPVVFISWSGLAVFVIPVLC